MKKLISLVVVMVLVLSFASCSNGDEKDMEAAKVAAVESVDYFYSVMDMLFIKTKAAESKHNPPIVSSVEKSSDGCIIVSGSITGSLSQGVTLPWSANWTVVMEKDDSGKYVVAESPAPDYGEMNFD